MIVGGALKADTAEVWARIVELAGGPGAPIAVFGMASDDPVASADAVIATLQRHGARPYFVPLAIELPGSDYRRAAADADNVAAVARARGVYFTGGDQARITRALIGPEGGRTPVLDAVWEVFERGGVVAGSSAGAAIMSRVMFSEPASTIELLTRGARHGSDIAPGLGFVGPELFVDQHVLARGRFARMVVAMVAAQYRVGLGVDENTAAEVGPDGRITIVGRSGAVLIRLDDATCERTPAGLRVVDARIGLLRPGDVYDPSSDATTPAASKHRIDRSFAAGAGEEPIVADIIAPGALVASIDGMIDRGRSHAVGETSGGTERFLFDFRRSPASRVFATDDPSTRTVLDLTLAIEPARCQRGHRIICVQRKRASVRPAAVTVASQTCVVRPP